MFKKSDEEDSYRERVYTKIKKVTQKTTRKNDYKKNSQKKVARICRLRITKSVD